MAEEVFLLLDLPTDLIQCIINWLDVVDQLKLFNLSKYINKHIYIRYFSVNRYRSSRFLSDEILEQPKYDKLLYLDLSNIKFSIFGWSYYIYLRTLILPDMRHGSYLAGVYFDDNLEGLINLEVLYFGHASPEEVDVSNLVNLKEIRLRYSHKFTTESFIQSQKIEKIVMCYRDIKDFDFSLFPKLKYLELYDCVYTKEYLQQLVNLERLIIDEEIVI